MATKSQSKSSSGKSTRSNASTKGDIKGKKKVTVEEVCTVHSRVYFDKIWDFVAVKKHFNTIAGAWKGHKKKSHNI